MYITINQIFPLEIDDKNLLVDQTLAARRIAANIFYKWCSQQRDNFHIFIICSFAVWVWDSTYLLNKLVAREHLSSELVQVKKRCLLYPNRFVVYSSIPMLFFGICWRPVVSFLLFYIVDLHYDEIMLKTVNDTHEWVMPEV